jgi:dTDP-3,4-didehydro-2,6-dideoxy-alpha-D-glucose 3-reductase
MGETIISIGVLGCSNIALRSIIPAINELEDKFILTSIASRSKENAVKYAKELKITPYYSYKDLIEKADINAVYIPLPNSLHAEWIEKALKKRLHVLVEKSLACSLAEVKKLNRLAQKSNLALIENFQFRFHPQIKIIQDLLKNSAIGELRCIRSSFGFPPFKNKDNIRYKKELGGGALLDAGAYPIKISQIFMGKDIHIKASSLMIDKNIGVDIWGGAFIKQKNGPTFSEISFGFDNFYQCNIELWGNKGKISTNRIFTSPVGYNPKILLENNQGSKIIEVEESNHFVNMLVYFYKNIFTQELREEEYDQNFNQARLIEEFKTKVNE